MLMKIRLPFLNGRTMDANNYMLNLTLPAITGRNIGMLLDIEYPPNCLTRRRHFDQIS
jgi:hypothetical protein